VPYLSALEVHSWRGAIQIHVYLYLYLCLKGSSRPGKSRLFRTSCRFICESRRNSQKFWFQGQISPQA